MLQVTDLPIEGGSATDRFEYTDAGTRAGTDMGQRITALLGVLTRPVQRALASTGAEEWTLEVSMGFKGGAGVPFIANGEANGAVKVTAKWRKDG